MNDLIIISVIIAVAIIAGIVIVWRQQMKMVKDAEWLNKNRPSHPSRKDVNRQIYESDVVEIDLQKTHRISGSDIHTVTNNYIRRMNKDKLITWTDK